MRATTLLNRLLGLGGVRVVDVDLDGLDTGGPVLARVASRRRVLSCPHCGFRTPHRYDRREVDSRWRHLDLGGHRLVLAMRRRWLSCPVHGWSPSRSRVARPGSGFTSDVEDLVVWLVTKADKTTVATVTRVAWRTVGAMCQRVSKEKLDPGRLAGLVEVGVDEISWRKHHKYLTLVSDHETSTIVWGTAGKNAAALGRFFDDLPVGGVEAVSMDLGPAYAKAVRERAQQAVICFDPFHVVKLASDALESVRRQVWQFARALPDKDIAKKYKGARWSLLKNPADLTPKQAQTLAGLTQTRRRAVAGLPAQGGPARGVRRRPGTPGRDGPAGALVLAGPTLAHPRVRQDRSHDPHPQGRHRRRRQPGPGQRTP